MAFPPSGSELASLPGVPHKTTVDGPQGSAAEEQAEGRKCLLAQQKAGHSEAWSLCFYLRGDCEMGTVSTKAGDSDSEKSGRLNRGRV